MPLQLLPFALSLSTPVLNYAEGGCFRPCSEQEGLCFDKLSTNGSGR